MSAPQGAGFTTIALLMLVVGMGIPITAALNAGLGQQINNPVAASTILFGAGFVMTAVALAFVGLPERGALAGVSPWSYVAALGVVLYIIAVTWSAPRIGVGNAIFFVLLGQLIAAAAIDHLGLFSAARTPITIQRAAGLLVMAVGVYLAKKSR